MLSVLQAISELLTANPCQDHSSNSMKFESHLHQLDMLSRQTRFRYTILHVTVSYTLTYLPACGLPAIILAILTESSKLLFDRLRSVRQNNLPICLVFIENRPACLAMTVLCSLSSLFSFVFFQLLLMISEVFSRLSCKTLYRI